VDIAQVERALRALPGVTDVHDLHIWALGTNATALSAHLTLPSGSPGDEFLAQAKSTLKSLGVDHPTLQLERAPHRDCGCC
jgi:cobalt-zinc-cadmium efflux system protein